MHGLTTFALLHVAVFATTGSEYQKAYNRAEKAGKPLLVLVGADRNPDYSVMKQQTMPELKRSGGLKNIVFTEVDSDAIPDLTRQLLRGNSLPQLVLYTPVGKLWRRKHLAGAQSQSEVRAFLKREIAIGRKVAERARQKSATAWHGQSKVAYSYSPGGS